MPLVQFKYRVSPDFNNENENAEEINMSIKLPLNARAASWKLKKVEVSYLKRVPLKVRFSEISFPELMNGNHVMYSLNSEGNTPVPNKTLRFYMNHYNNDQQRNHSLNENASNLRACLSNPDLDLGYHIIDKMELNLNFAMKNTDGGTTTESPNAFNIILEYNE